MKLLDLFSSLNFDALLIKGRQINYHNLLGAYTFSEILILMRMEGVLEYQMEGQSANVNTIIV